MALDVSLADAYAEACKALGEQTVTARLLSVEVQRLTARVAELEAAPPADPT